MSGSAHEGAWRRRAAAFALTMLASSALNCVWVTFSLSYFRGPAAVPAAAFFPLQAAFAMWNGVNDPLFGWLSDARARGGGGGGSGGGPAGRRAVRVAALRWGGAAWAAAFALAWSPLALPPAAHFFLFLCAYDAALTFVEVNHGALLAELSPDPARRAQANMLAALAAAAGSTAVLLAHALYDAADLRAFRAFTVALALAAAVAFELSARGVALPASSGGGGDGGGDSDGDGDSGVRAVEAAAAAAPLPAPRRVTRQALAAAGGGRGRDAVAAAAPPPPPLSYLGFLQQLLRSGSIVTFVCVATIQSFDCNVEKSLFAPAAELLAAAAPSAVREVGLAAFAEAAKGGTAAALSLPARSVALFLSFLLPHTLTVLWTPLAAGWGVQRTLRAIIVLRLVVLVASAAFVGTEPAHAPRAALLALLVNRVLSESVCRLFPLVLSGLIDEDAARNHRRQAVSASLVGAVTACAKVGASLAPMVGFLALPEASAAGLQPSAAAAAHAWQLLLGLPAACVLAQLALLAATDIAAARAPLPLPSRKLLDDEN